MLIWAFIFAILIGLLTPIVFIPRIFRKSALAPNENSKRRIKLIVVANVASFILASIPLLIAGVVFFKETNKIQDLYKEDIFSSYGLELSQDELNGLGFGRYAFITGPVIGESVQVYYLNNDGIVEPTTLTVRAGDGSGNYYLEFSN